MSILARAIEAAARRATAEAAVIDADGPVIDRHANSRRRTLAVTRILDTSDGTRVTVDRERSGTVSRYSVVYVGLTTQDLR